METVKSKTGVRRKKNKGGIFCSKNKTLSGNETKGIKLFFKNIQLTLLALPGVAWLLIFSYIPMFGLILAFKKFNYQIGIFGSPWIGLENFKMLFASSDAFNVIRNTVLYNITFIIVGTFLSIIVAIMLETITKKVFIKAYQTVLLLPHFISWVVVGFATIGLFTFENGFINTLIKTLGGEGVMWYSEPKMWPGIILIAYLWKQLGYNTLLYYGSILGIDTSLYEAAKVDGANKIQQIIHITIPMLRPTICVLLIVSIGGMMKGDFGLFYYIPNNTGALYAATDVLDTYIYRMMSVVGDIGISSAISLFQSVVGFILVLCANAVIRKIDNDSAMF